MKLDMRKIGVIIVCLFLCCGCGFSKKITVEFSGVDGYKNVEIKKGDTLSKPKTPEKEGYTFDGWYLDGELFDFSTKIKGDIKLEARFTKKVFTITFDTKGGSEVEEQRVEYGEEVKKPNNPTKTGYTFVEWRLENKKYNFNTKVTDNMVLVAVWKEKTNTVVKKTIKYTVKFDMDGGEPVKDLVVIEGNKVTLPENPTKEGYTFVMWTLDGEEFDLDYVVNKNITIKAVWKLIPLNISEEMAENATEFVGKIYNKYTEVTLKEEDLETEGLTEIYYVDLGLYKGSEVNNETTLKIEDNTYNQNDYKLSIGNNGFVEVPVWKVLENEDGEMHLYVAYAWLAVDSLPVGETSIVVGDQEMAVVTYDEVKENLVIDSVVDIATVGYTHELKVDKDNNKITYNYGYGLNGLGVILKDSNKKELVTDEELLVFVKNTKTGNVGVTTPESGYTTLIYLTYVDEVFKETKVFNKEYKFAIPGVGVIDITVDGANVEEVAYTALGEVEVNTDGVKYVEDRFVIYKENVTLFEFTDGEVVKTATKVDDEWNFGTNYMDIMAENATKFVESIYNKYPNRTLTLTDLKAEHLDNIYYIDFGVYTGTTVDGTTTLKIEGNTYNQNNYKLSIGNNGFVNAPVWRVEVVEDGEMHLYVAYAWLAVDSLPVGITDIVIGGQTFSIVTYATVKENLAVDSVVDIAKDGYTSDLKVNGTHITYNFGYGTNMLGVLLKNKEDNTLIKDQTLLVFLKDVNTGDMAITPPEDDYTFLIYPSYKEGTFNEVATYNKEYKLAIPGVGVIELTFDGKKLEEVQYEATGEVVVDVEGVTYTETGFVIAVDINTFKFMDGTTHMVATKTGDTWTFEEEVVEPIPEPIGE